jgi:hypothetical protein
MEKKMMNKKIILLPKEKLKKKGGALFQLNKKHLIEIINNLFEEPILTLNYYRYGGEELLEKLNYLLKRIKIKKI